MIYRHGLQPSLAQAALPSTSSNWQTVSANSAPASQYPEPIHAALLLPPWHASTLSPLPEHQPLILPLRLRTEL